MSHFYSTIRGQAGEATRRGSKASGVIAVAAGWGGAVEVRLYYDPASGRDYYAVEARPWHGAGNVAVLATGVLGTGKNDLVEEQLGYTRERVTDLEYDRAGLNAEVARLRTELARLRRETRS